MTHFYDFYNPAQCTSDTVSVSVLSTNKENVYILVGMDIANTDFYIGFHR